MNDPFTKLFSKSNIGCQNLCMVFIFLIQLASQSGYITINWKKVNKDVGKISKNVTKKFDEYKSSPEQQGRIARYFKKVCGLFQSISFHFTSLHFTSLHFSSFHFTSLHFSSFHFTSLHLTSLHFTLLYFTLLYFTSLHFNFTLFIYALPHFSRVVKSLKRI